MTSTYKLSERNSNLYGKFVRADFNYLSWDELSSLVKECSLSFLGYGYSQDSKPAFLEVLVRDEQIEYTASRVRKILGKRGYKEKEKNR